VPSLHPFSKISYHAHKKMSTRCTLKQRFRNFL
jgi:hypothetical protein